MILYTCGDAILTRVIFSTKKLSIILDDQRNKIAPKKNYRKSLVWPAVWHNLGCAFTAALLNYTH